MNLSSLKKEQDEFLYTIDPATGSSFTSAESDDTAGKVEVAKVAPAEGAKPLWSDVDGKRVYHFPNADLENVVASLIKRGAKYSRKYDLKPLSVTFQAITDREQAELNDLLQLISNKGDIRWRKTTQELDSAEEKEAQRVLRVQTETQDVVHQDSARAMRTATLAFYLIKISDDNFATLTVDERASALEQYSPDLLDWIFYNPYLHFRGLLMEAMKTFSAF
jgi:hypothetical protein